MLSQYVEGVYARELLAGGEGGVGYLLKDRVTSLEEFTDALLRRPAGPGEWAMRRRELLGARAGAGAVQNGGGSPLARNMTVLTGTSG